MAFGEETPSMLLTAFSSPRWLLIVANVIVIFDMTSSFNIFSQTVFLTIEEWAAHKLGMLHPAEAAALDAADDAWTAEDMEGSEKEPKPERMPPANPATAAGGAALPGAVLRTRTLQRSTTGERVVLRTRTPHPRSGAYLSRGKDGSQVEAAADDMEPLRGKVLTTVASRAHRTVHCIAGPLRMTSMLRDAKVLRPELPRIKVWSARSMSFLIRTAYVGLVTVVAVFCPFFGSVAGLVGAVAYWPLQILFPTLMFFSAYPDQLPAWKRRGLVAVNVSMAIISVCAVIGSFRNMITGWESFSLA
ncbi:transmembrane amino acid transporter [Chlorella sorokiniana]|uniref:Transmembrane amino acid transporter n=1 Tax=Chlorella sorokiniana TaxID=3076 RepID=A0A2P6TT39_CHLSO|nr:transmembrane amino acid transporter [Chlorella sorokiniana]|eukprot:PRW57214.1 transmembrane amino acid transporter [Chlorella sorokiniana]